MRKAALPLLLAWVLLGTTATLGQQDGGWTGRIREAVFQAVWCAYMVAHPYYLDAPDELTCDYQRRPMTLEEAQSYYQGNVRRLNLTLAQWQCASSKDDLSWKEDRTWSKEYERAQKRFNSALSEVEWPADVKTKVARLIDRNQSEVYYLRSAYNHKSLGQSFTSGDFWKWIRAADKSSEAASQVRLTLRIPAVPTAPDNCVQARRLQRALDIASD